MKKIALLAALLLFVSCQDNTRINNCFRNFLNPISLDLNNPQLNGVLTPTGFSAINGGLAGIILYNGATLGFKAFDRKCPNFDCSTPMSFDGQRLKCICDDTEYSILTGEPLPQGTDTCFAREYSVSQNGTSLRISN
jgi:nitrite reductase/ring-hydroxylating ferredoxin subunit